MLLVYHKAAMLATRDFWKLLIKEQVRPSVQISNSKWVLCERMRVSNASK